MESLMESETKTDTPADWLGPLEEKVHATVERLQALQVENAALRQRIEDLEERLAAPGDSGAGWEEERREIRERVERLTRTLEGLD